MRILANGNVGIGTTSPAAQLHVYGANQATSALNTSTGLGGAIYVQDAVLAN